MAIDGGGGGGGGILGFSNSFTGPAEALEVIGDHVYAYSGGVTTSNSGYVTMLAFTTGNFYSVGTLTLDASTTDNDPAAGLRSNFKLSMNGIVIGNFATVSGQGSAASPSDVIPILIPPYTEIIVANRATASTGTVFCQIVGRIYRTQ